MFLDSYQKYVCLDLGKNDEYLIFWSPMFFNFSPTPLIFLQLSWIPYKFSLNPKPFKCLLLEESDSDFEVLDRMLSTQAFQVKFMEFNLTWPW